MPGCCDFQRHLHKTLLPSWPGLTGHDGSEVSADSAHDAEIVDYHQERLMTEELDLIPQARA